MDSQLLLHFIIIRYINYFQKRKYQNIFWSFSSNAIYLIINHDYYKEKKTISNNDKII